MARSAGSIVRRESWRASVELPGASPVAKVFPTEDRAKAWLGEQTAEGGTGKVARQLGNWQATVKDPDRPGKEHSRTFATKAAAQRWVTEQLAAKDQGRWIDPSAGQVTFAEYAEKWRANQVHRPSTSAQVESYLRLHVYPHIGHRPLASFRPSDIQAFVKRLTAGDADHKPLAPATVHLVYTWVSTVFAAAAEDRLIASSPCGKRVRRPTIERQPVVPLPVATVEALIEAVADRYRALVVLGAGTGVRISEALGLTNDRIDWLRHSVRIDRQLVGVKDGDPVFGPVKDAHNRPRDIPLPQSVVDALAEHVAKYGLGPQGLLFTAPDGGPARRNRFADAWRAAADPLGIPVGDGFHQLRHFYASLLIAARVPVNVVQARLGHTSAQMILDVYAGLWPDNEDETRAAVDAVLAKRAATA